MDFLSSPLWWVLFSLSAVFCFVMRFGNHGRGTLSPLIRVLGFIGLLAIAIVTFFIIDWKACIAIIMFDVLFAFVSDLILWQLFRLYKPSAKDIAFNQFLKRERRKKAQNDLTWTTESPKDIFKRLETEEEADEERMNNIVKKISSQPKMLDILKKYGKEPQDVIEIKKDLAYHTGKEVAEDALQNAKLLDLYLQMIKDGEKLETIAARILLALGL
jgi:ABC-type transport system involved in multi-copper enzyme maturation permease subunit